MSEISVELPQWQEALVVQKDRKNGAIPAGFEWMIKFNKINNVNFDTFQDDFNLKANDTGKNSFASISQAIENIYPHIKIQCRNFDKGREKIKFIQDLIDSKIPCMMKFAISAKQNVAHEMPVVIYEERLMRLVWQVIDVNKPDMFRVEYNDIVHRHNKWESAREVAWLEPLKAT